MEEYTHCINITWSLVLGNSGLIEQLLHSHSIFLECNHFSVAVEYGTNIHIRRLSQAKIQSIGLNSAFFFYLNPGTRPKCFIKHACQSLQLPFTVGMQSRYICTATHTKSIQALLQLYQSSFDKLCAHLILNQDVLSQKKQHSIGHFNFSESLLRGWLVRYPPNSIADHWH